MLEMVLFISPNNFWRAEKLHDFEKKCWELSEMLTPSTLHQHQVKKTLHQYRILIIPLAGRLGRRRGG
jgi:hypothetical protein